MSDQAPPPPPPPPPPPGGGFPPPPPPGEGFGTPPGGGFGPPPGGGFGTPPPAGYTPYSAAPTGPGGVAPMGTFGARLGGWLIDGLIMGAFLIPAGLAITAGPRQLTECTVDSSGSITGFGGQPNAVCETPTGATWVLTILLFVAALVAALVYQAKLAGGPSGQTVGMKVVGVKVIDGTSGAPIGSGRAIGRFLFGATISGWFCYLGYLWNLWDPQKQTWHDKVTSAIVIKT